MKNSLFGVIIKVNDINLCRRFYRDILNLGDPVVDSSFCVEFQVSKDFSLTLEKRYKHENDDFFKSDHYCLL